MAMFLMCPAIPSLAPLPRTHNKLLAWKRNDLAMMLNDVISLWSLDISLDQGLGTLLIIYITQVAKRYRNEGEREGERVCWDLETSEEC